MDTKNVAAAAAVDMAAAVAEIVAAAVDTAAVAVEIVAAAVDTVAAAEIVAAAVDMAAAAVEEIINQFLHKIHTSPFALCMRGFLHAIINRFVLSNCYPYN